MHAVNIVIIGAGVTGVVAAQILGKNLKGHKSDVVITVVEKQAQQHHHIGSLRALVDKDYAPKVFVPYDNAWPEHQGQVTTKRVQGLATTLEANQVTVALSTDGTMSSEEQVLPFDYIIFAMGSSYGSPVKPTPNAPQSRASIDEARAEAREAIETATTTAIVGGGAVGLELAGEIRDKHPHKKVVLFDHHDTLLSSHNIKDDVKTKALDILTRTLGIEVILGDRLETAITGTSYTKQTLTTASGRCIEADVTFFCTGSRPSGTEMLKAFSPHDVDDRGAVRVKASLQLEHQQHMFAIGDVNNHATPKLAFWGAEQAKYVAKHLAAVVKKHGSEYTTKAFDYGGTEALMLPLGRSHGVSQLPMFGGVMMGNFFTKKVKGGDLFTGQAWKALGAKVPK